MRTLVDRVTGNPETVIHGFVAVEPDGRVFAGNREHGVLVLRSEDYLRRIVPVDAEILPATLTIHRPSPGLGSDIDRIV